MSEDRLYYYNNAWYTYVELYSRFGVTLAPSDPIIVYDTDLSEYSGWVDTSSNIWVAADSKWYTYGTLPYYIKLSDIYNIYLITELIGLSTYKKGDSILYGYDGSLKSYLYMHNNYGITLTPSYIYQIYDGVIKSWYNPDINQYWNVDAVRWQALPPNYGSTTPDIIDPDISNINQIGALGIFAIEKDDDVEITLGTIVDGSLLKPVCLNFEFSGEASCSDISSDHPTGMWRLLSTTSKGATRCIVLAIKVSDDTPSTPIAPDITNLDQVGATGMFLLNKANSDELIYGTLIDSSRLSPVSITFNEQGELSYTVVELDNPITGFWRLFTTAVRDSNQCIVIARKTS